MRQRPIIEALEPRILYSADLGPLLTPAGIGPAGAEQRVIHPDLEFSAYNELALQSVPLEIVFIDARTPDYALLVADIAAQSERQLYVVMLDADRNGVEQITEALAGRENVAALHIIGHGGDGVIQLGNERITADTLQRNPDRVEAWRLALTADADILLYGCDVAASAQGRLLADTLARLTGADVAASDNPTGYAGLGGDWKLEYATGAINVPVALSMGGQDAWSHLLPSIVLTSYEPPFANMTDFAYQVSGSATYAQSFSVSGAGTYTVNQLDFVIYRNALANGSDLTIELRAVSASGTLLASGSVSRAELSQSENWVSVSLGSSATLTYGTTYYVVVKGIAGGNVFVGVDDSGTSSYAAGNFINNGTPDTTKDMAFRVVFTDGPVVDLNGNQAGADYSVTFTAPTPEPITRTNGATITDLNSTNLASLTATLTARPNGDAFEFLSLNAAATLAASGLTVGYTASTGVLSITGTATVSTYQTILRGIQYNNTSGAPNVTDRVVTIVASDGATTSAPRISIIHVTLTNSAPVITGAGGTLAYSEGDPAQVIDSSLTITDANDTNIESATVSISGGLVITEDVLGFTSAGGITGSYTAATGVLALSGTATLGDYKTTLESVTYLNTNTDNPNTGTRTITWVVNDGEANSIGVTSTITVAAVNDAPVVTASGGVTAFTEGNNVVSTPVAVDGAVTVSDADNATLASATVAISGGLQTAEDVLGFTNNPATMGNITGSYNAGSGVLSLTSAGATATLAQWQAALRAVTYTNTSEAPDTANRTVSFTVNDGASASAASTKTVSVTAVNDVPVVTASGGTTPFTEDGGAVAVDGALTVADADNATLASATVAISGGLQTAEDVLGFTNNPATMGNITGSYNAGSGVLSLTSAGATATLAQWQAALRAVTYTNTSEAPDTANRTVSFTVNDGASASAASTKTVSVTAVNDAPANTVPGPQLTSEDTALVFSASGGNAIIIADIDAGASPVQVTLTGTNGVITLAGIAGLTFSAGDGTADATMTFSGTVAAINAAMNGLSFMPSANFSGAASLSIATNDLGNTGTGGPLSDSDSVAITVTANIAPTVTASGGTTPFIEGNNVVSTPIIVDSALTVSDPDSTTLASATVAVSAGLQPTEDVLGFTNNPATMGNITGSYNAASGVLSLTSAGATATLAQWQTALRAVTYANTSETPNTANRTVSILVSGFGGNSAVSTKTVTVTAVNDAPVVAASGGGTAFTEGNNVVSTPVAVDGAVTVSDADNATLASATVAISGGLQTAEDVLGFTNNPATMGNITGSYNASSGVLSLTSAGATATLAQWQAALRAVTYTNTSEAPNTANRTVSFAVNDGTSASAASTQSLSVAAVNDTPVVTASAGATDYLTAGMAMAVDGGAAVSDLDHATLPSATVSIGGGFQPMEDRLGFTGDPATTGNITGSYNAGSGVLSLTSAGATATLAQWQAALRAVIYVNASSVPINGFRSVSFELSDGAASSPAATKTIVVNVPAVVVLPPSASPPAVVTEPGPPAVVSPPAASNPPQQSQPSSTSSGPTTAGGETSPEPTAAIPFPYTGPDGTILASGSGRLMSVATLDTIVPSFRAVTYGIVAPGAEVAREFLAEALKQVELRPLELFQLVEKQLGRSASGEGFAGDLSRLSDALREEDEIQTRTVVTLTAGSLSMTLGYLLWLIRGGALAASVLSALPAWRLLDPLPVLARVDDGEDQDDGEDEHAIASFSGVAGGGKPT